MQGRDGPEHDREGRGCLVTQAELGRRGARYKGPSRERGGGGALQGPV